MTSEDSTDSDYRRQCWVCFASDEDDYSALWVRPCNCRGTTKWVHQMCLQRWIDEKQRGNPAAPVKCPQCGALYAILFPTMGPLVTALDVVYEFYSRSCPFVAAGVVVGSLYWSAVTYGAVTVMQVAGYHEGMAAMEKADPIFLLVSLPTIPLALVMAKMVRWEDMVLRAIYQCSARLPGQLKQLLAGGVAGDDPHRSSPLPPLPASSAAGGFDRPFGGDPMSATRVVCSALLLPSAAALAGKLLFDSVSCRVQRALLGGVVLVAVKGVLKIYHKHKQLVRLSQRQVLDFDDEQAKGLRNTVSSTSSSNEQF